MRKPNKLLTTLIVGVASIAVATVISTHASAVGETATPQGRVDLETPTFSNPTEITNPLFPISQLDQVIQLGEEAGVALRNEITLLDETRFITWNGQDIEALVSQFVAYGDEQILEIATDYFAQADDGSVWYLGENVTNYENGRVANHDGTWIAGVDGPAGMIMPADPEVGDVYRPENIPGFVFEEVTVIKTNLTVEGPTGPVPGAILVSEELMDGTLEDKIFAPGYGEFQASVPTEDEFVRVAIAVPIDQGQGPAPEMLVRQLSHAEDQLEVALATLDLELQTSDRHDVDVNRIEVWQTQLRRDVAAGDAAAVASDRVIIAAINFRL